MIPKSVAKRTYLLTTIMFTVLMLFFVYRNAEMMKEQIFQQKEHELLLLAVYLDQQMPRHAADLLQDGAVRKLSQAEKIRLLNSQLQAALAKVGQEYKQCGLGYGINNERLAVYPPRPEILTRPFAAAGVAAIKQAYATRKTVTFTNDRNTLWQQPTLSVLYPHIVDGEVAWFTWTNARVEYINNTFMAALWQSGATFFLLWVGAMLILRYTFRQFDTLLSNVARQVVTKTDSPEQLRQFPELAPLLTAVTSLRKGLEQECAAKTQLNHTLTLLNQRQRIFKIFFTRNLAPMAIVRQEDLMILDVNYAAEQLMQAGREEITGRTVPALNFGNADSPTTIARLAELQANGYTAGLAEFRTLAGDNRYGIISVIKTEYCAEEQYLITLIDITEQRLSEERFLKAFHANPLMMSIVSLQDWKILAVNQAYLTALDRTYEEVAGKTSDQITLWKDETCLQQLRLHILHQQGKCQNYEIDIVTNNNEVRTVLFSSEVISLEDEQCLLGMFTDITEIKRYKYEMARLDRLDIVGEMAAGIGHEVRNPMTTVRGYLQIFQRKAELAKYHSQIAIMIEEIDRANAIITEFLSLAKNKKIEIRRANLNAVIQALAPLLQADALRRGHDLRLTLADLPEFDFDENEIRQLILNLVRNGLEAMTDSGLVTISTAVRGAEIELTITDQGCGMPPAILEKIGTPFVTTKDEGTGLGLPVCYRIAARHNAEICVHSSPAGTAFRIVFAAAGTDEPVRADSSGD
ncbi:ATP-binding protein [Sporomusa termitida]|uniref:histidine kinase n=1 Tax=Sporomusa termitida TaxID=2377 RepID=A0A517DRA0_9FIRM|nr:ATP-binding protein [Sporomusa termitida]QDR79881.1 Adaptive-response sensory-kinase SasA [Sporomusa termitida]